MKAGSDNFFLEHSHSGLHRFEDTEIGALERRAEDLRPIGTQLTARAFSLSRRLSPGGACQIFLKAGNAVAQPRPLGLGGGIEPPRQQ